MIKLYQYEDCPFCAKVRRKLDELKLDYEKINVDPVNKPDVVLSVGHTVPVIDDDGMVMNESDKIMRYLEEKYESKGSIYPQ